MPKKSDAGGMSDKSRQEFVEKWLPMIEFKTGWVDIKDCDNGVFVGPTSILFDQMLTEYDKLKSDRWADMLQINRLKDFVNKEMWRKRLRPDSEWVLGYVTGLKFVLSEIERLEKEE